jgi:hypothetical protein
LAQKETSIDKDEFMKTEETLKNEAEISNLNEAYEKIISLHKRIDKLNSKIRSADNVIKNLYHTPSNHTNKDFTKLWEEARDYLQFYETIT